MTANDFKVGDIVIHVTSGQKGVVVHLHRTCVTEDHKGPVGCLRNNFNGCVYEVYGIDVSYGIDCVAKLEAPCCYRREEPNDG